MRDDIYHLRVHSPITFTMPQKGHPIGLVICALQLLRLVLGSSQTSTGYCGYYTCGAWYTRNELMLWLLLLVTSSLSKVLVRSLWPPRLLTTRLLPPLFVLQQLLLLLLLLLLLRLPLLLLPSSMITATRTSTVVILCQDWESAFLYTGSPSRIYCVDGAEGSASATGYREG